ncbi:MAG: hypothetical protein WBC71_13400 [Salaquimonas sp.]
MGMLLEFRQKDRDFETTSLESKNDRKTELGKLLFFTGVRYQRPIAMPSDRLMARSQVES